MPDIFLSYSREDQAAARRFAQGFEREGLDVWWDQTLHSGENYDQVTERALREAAAVVVLWSRTSVESRWVRAEATQADRLGTLMPATIEPCNRPIMFELKHTAELAHWKGEASDAAWRAFVGDVRRFVDRRAAVGGSGAGIPGVPAAAMQPTSAPWRWLVLGALALLLVAGGWFWMQQSGRKGDTVVAASTPAVSQATAALVTLAVLPFADLSQAKDQEYFSDGLTEEILNQLAQVKELAVTGRTSSFSFKGKNEDLRAIAQKLGVANLLEGSVRKNGNELRITAQLIDGSSGAHRWSQTYARELRDVFAVQEEIARDVARALKVALDVGEMSRAKGGTTDIEAYDRYLQARKLFLEGGRESSLRAVALLREAVGSDPQFVRAWELLAQASGLAAVTSPQAEAAQLRRQATEARQHVRTLAPDSAAARADRISELISQRKWAEAVEAVNALKSSTLLTADDLTWGSAVLNVSFATGRVNETIRVLREFMQREPLSMLASNDLQRMLYVAGQYDAAQVENERSRTLPGDWSRPRGRALLLALRREPIDAQAVKALLAQTNRDEGLILSSTLALDELGTDRKAMQDALRREFASNGNPTTTELALFYQQADALGDRELALSALEKVIEAGTAYPVLWLGSNSGVRSEPRFKALLRESGLVDYWRKSGNWGDFCKPVGDDDFECR